MSKNIIMSERTISRYEELYPKTVASQISDVYSKSETSNLFLPKSGGSMGGVLDMNGNKITNLAYPTDSLDSANKKYVDENLVFKKVKLVDNLNLSFSEGKSFTINYPSGFTVSDILNAKFVLYDFFNISIPNHQAFYLGADYQGAGILNLQTNETLDKVSYSIPIINKTWTKGYVNVSVSSASSYVQIMYAGPTSTLAYFYCGGQVSGKVSIYFIM